jgi:GDP-L-fucose synthase
MQIRKDSEMDLKGKAITVTGGNGFLGKNVVQSLVDRGAVVSVPRSSVFDLRKREAVSRMYEAFEPEAVIHLAAVCGGIGANQSAPGRFLYDNLTMGLELIDAAKDFKIKKFVQVGTVCSYPKHCPIPFREEDLWSGYPEETNAPYGLAKKMLLVQCQAYRRQYGLNAVYLVPVNLYGPGDNFNPDTSHVIPALIKKCIEAKTLGAPSITVWGTGSAYREFLYVEDCAEAIVKATALYEGADPVNIGTGSEIPMRDLVDTIKSVTGYEGEVVYDTSKPDGQPRRQLDTTRAKENFGFTASTDLLSGLRQTVEWYNENSRSNILV